MKIPTGSLRHFNVHLVGIGGCGMSGIAAILLRRGAAITGSDSRISPTINQLSAAGATVYIGDDGVIPAECHLVVASAAIPPNHPELAAAKHRQIPIVKYAQLLGELMRQYFGIAVAGTHGKSTSTAWLAFVLKNAGIDPNFVVGATSEQLGGSSGVGNGVHFVVESCEYDRSFLNLHPKSAAILNIDEDHLDYYSGIDDIKAAFSDFSKQIASDGLLVINGDNEHCQSIAADRRRTETFGLADTNDWQARNLSQTDGFFAYDLYHKGQLLTNITLGIAGKHNVYNSLAVIALAHDAGIALDDICEGVREYKGVGRRLEMREEIHGVRIVDDYAHHPAEIRATLETARQRYSPNRLWCVFQPHQHSRTRFLLDDFAGSFHDADRILVPDIYFVRDSVREREAVSSEDLVNKINEAGGLAEYIPSFTEIVSTLASELQPGDVVLTMGAGSIWKVADDLVYRLRVNMPA